MVYMTREFIDCLTPQFIFLSRYTDILIFSFSTMLIYTIGNYQEYEAFRKENMGSAAPKPITYAKLVSA